MFLLLGADGVHRLPQLAAPLLGADSAEAARQALAGDFGAHAALSFGALMLPGLVAWGADVAACGAEVAVAELARRGGGAARGEVRGSVAPSAFVRLAYGWLPLVWAGSLAHWLDMFGAEAGTVLSAAAVGLGLPASAAPHAALAPPVTAFLQAALLVVGGGASTALTVHLGRADGLAPARTAAQAAGIAVVGLTLWSLIVRADFLVF